ncbi:hypothetical protein GCM10009525_27430 [Streptosporangium amethystogenes subsp. fukuiense]
MKDLDFYAKAATSGVVFGVQLSSTPAEVEERFGADFLDDRQRGVFRRDYGLLEFTFFRDPDWTCGAISIQVHRLLEGASDSVPSVLIQEFGEFSPCVKLSSLKREVGTLGFYLSEAPDQTSPDFTRFLVSQSGVEVVTTRGLTTDGKLSSEVGDVWSILVPGNFPPKKT